MRIFLLSLIVAALIGGVACREEPASAPAAPSPAAPEAAPTNESVAKIVALGDSLTAGYGLPPSQSYPALLNEKLKADGFEGYEVVNAGISGDTSAGGLRRIDWSLEGNVRIVILALGANDILRGQPISAMKSNLAQIIEKAQARGARVLLAGMESPTNAGSEYRREVREAYADLAKTYDVEFLPFILQDVAAIPSLNQADGIHPTAEGQRIVAENVYRVLKPMVEELEREARAAN